jgi:hypothetical protein
MDVDVDIEPFDIMIGFRQVAEFMKLKEKMDEF